jgi:uncharacterized protein (DUF1919 family)
MISNIKDVFDIQVAKIQRQRFRNNIYKIQQKGFTIISNNCVGSIFYQLLNLPYNTPTIGLFFFAPCFVKFASNLREYLREDLVQIEESRYTLGNIKREANHMYPLGKLGDIEIHFMHYASWDEALQKWTRRAKRIRFDNIFIISTDQELCNYSILKAFNQLPWPKKVCFTAKKYELESCVQIPYYANNDEVGNLVANYHLFNNCFDFVRWFDEPTVDMRA